MAENEREVWRDLDGNPLKFQDGDYVQIETASNPARVHTLPFLEGYVRGYNISEDGRGVSVAYELFKMGHSPLQFVREEFLTKVAESLPHTCHGRVCGICGDGDTPQGLSIFAGPKIKD
jgi:hypothetical protein